MQDASLRPSLKDIDEELTHLVSEQEALNESLAEKRQQDQALLHQMLPPQVGITLCYAQCGLLHHVENWQLEVICQLSSHMNDQLLKVLPGESIQIWVAQAQLNSLDTAYPQA